METFTAHVDWTGAAKGATRDAAAFSRDLQVAMGMTSLEMSSAPQFKGDPSRANPEQLFVAAISACHALTYLFLAARSGVVVTGYADDVEGTLEVIDGKLRMSRVVLHPRIVLERPEDQAQAAALIEKAHRSCFIGNSVLSRVDIEPSFQAATRLVA